MIQEAHPQPEWEQDDESLQTIYFSEPVQPRSPDVQAETIDVECMPLTDSAHPYLFRIGQQIDDRYQVVEPLGFGSFAEVYKCVDVQLDQTFAVKVMNLTASKRDVLREARITARLQHPHILRVINIGELRETGQSYIVMDYKPASRTLESVLDTTANSLRRLQLDEQTLQLVTEIAQALQHAHDNGVVHQDIKPSNIIIDQDWHAYLTDFGLASSKRSAGAGLSMKTLDAQSGMSGTIPYMSPEQFEELESDKEIGPATDVYSLVVVVYEMLVGQLPYPGKATGPIIRQIIEGVRTPPRQFNAEIPEKVEEVLLKGLSKAPERRFGSAAEFAQALRAAAQAYITAEELYKEACRFFDEKNWRVALERFIALEDHAPDYKETRLFMERVRKQVQLLNLYEDAQDFLERQEYVACLDKLDVLSQLDAGYPVGALSEKALAALTSQLYRHASAQCQAGDCRECLSTLDEIHARDPDFADPDCIGQQARCVLERQEYLKNLYDASVRQIRAEDWDGAQQTLQELHDSAADYADVEARLTMVRYIARLSGLYHSAQDLYATGEYAGCIDTLSKISQIDRDYKLEQIVQLHTRALEALYEKARRLLSEDRFEAAIRALDELQARSDLDDPAQVRAQAQEGIARRTFRQGLDSLYEQAIECLRRREYRECLDLMAAIREQDSGYQDPRELEQRAQESYCAALYTQALVALTRRRYAEALRLWQDIVRLAPHYADPQNIQVQAASGLERAKWLLPYKRFWARVQMLRRPETRQKLARLRRPLLYGAIAVMLVVFALAAVWGTIRVVNDRAMAIAAATATEAVAAIAREIEATVTVSIARTTAARLQDNLGASTIPLMGQAMTPTMTSTPTPIPEPTATPASTPTPAPTATATQLPTPTETAMPVPTPTRTSTPTETPTPTQTPLPQAKIIQASTVYAGPQVGTQERAIVNPGEMVDVLGRADERRFGRWLYVRTAGGVEGFVYEPRVTHTADWESLSIVDSEAKVLTPSPTPSPVCPTDLVVSSGRLQIVQIWPAAACAQGGWTAYFEVEIAGGDGCAYQIFWEGRQVEYQVKAAEPHWAVIQVPGQGGKTVGTVKVVSGGQTASRAASVDAPTKCQ
ncbi:MAG: protein kinase [Anaerolineae bacterium]|nr:protein kinase [Anaerolineae bacterium]